MMDETIQITYQIDFDDGQSKEFSIVLDRETLDFINEDVFETPDWADLNYEQCEHCPLSEVETKNCPVAFNMKPLTDEFNGVDSLAGATVSVITEERTYQKKTSLEEALSGLMGLIMVTSGCPVMDYLRPMARFHMPFSNSLETSVRSISMYLLAQYIYNQSSKTINMDMNEFEKIYKEIGQVNRDFAKRLRSGLSNDASLEALTNLDYNATLTSFTIDDALDEMEKIFSAYK